MKVLVCDPIDENGVNLLKENGFEVDVKTGMDPDELKKTIKGYEVMVVRSATKVTKDVIDSADNLKLVVRGGVGIDNIDTQAAKAKNIAVKNTPAASTVSVAEHTFALLLTLARKLHEADKSTKEGKWEKKKLKGTELYNKTLGLVGVGRIGLAVAKRALGFEMKVLGFDPYIDKKTLGENNITSVEKLDDLLSRSDIISIHSPLTDETKNLINETNINKMKNGAIVVNSARGGVVDESALAKALQSGKLSGAALDVYEKEPLVDSPLMKLNNIVLAPHIAASTQEAQERVGIESAKTIIEHFK
ncbi:MAG: hydroxyacid dehydrogenase [Spirochaetes bacterium]|nr:hydroxyacid dehydrogenase [Spirochaetota bacterium]